jgi:hypothetical protein
MAKNEASDWSLEKEICELAGNADFRSAMCQLNMLADDEEMYSVDRDKEWIRGGSETYLYRFWVNHQDGKKVGYIIKACVAFSVVSSLLEVFDEWMTRRRLLQANGISTPLLIVAGKAILIEELIPHPFKDLLIKPTYQWDMLTLLANWAGVLAKLGFSPLAPFDDLRSRGSDLVCIDFGEDLGPPHLTENSLEIYERMVSYLRDLKMNLSKDQMADLYDTYISFLDTSKT